MEQKINNLRKVAVFDIDGTIFRSSLLIELAEVCIEKGIFPESARAEYEQEKQHWLDRNGDYEAYIMAVVASFSKHIHGVAYEVFLDASKFVVARYRHRTYKFTEGLIKQLKQEGYFLLAISRSPKGTLDFFCEDIGFDKTYGTILEIDNEGVLTGGEVENHLISNKAGILERAIEKEGLTLEGSVGVGDTEGDISFLELVERPICFNPNKKLWEYAKEKGWEVVVERKDVVYEVNK